MRVYTQTPWVRNSSLSILLGSSDIARAFDLGNAAVVTNWRSRSTDFPAERVGGTQPKFDLVEVYEWLRDSGPRGRELPTISAERWWRLLVGAFLRQATVPSPRNTMASLVLLEHLLQHDPSFADEGPLRWQRLADLQPPQLPAIADPDLPNQVVEAFKGVARWVESVRPEYRGLFTEYLTLDLETAAYACDLVDAMQARPELAARARMRSVVSVESEGRTKAPLRRTTNRLARVMAAMAMPAAGATVLDPACGEGEVLKQCARRQSHLRLHGQELDPNTWAIARARLMVAGIEANLGQPGFDSLRDDQHAALRADVVIIDPPLGDGAPPIDRWIEHGLNHLGPDGRLVVAVPAHELVHVAAARRKPDARLAKILSGLVFDGALEGVIVLPRGLRADVVGPIAVLSLRPFAPATAAPSRIVVVADAAEYGVNDGVVERLRAGGWDGVAGMSSKSGLVTMADSDNVWAAVLDVVDFLESGGKRRPSEVDGLRSDTVESMMLMAPPSARPTPQRSSTALDELREKYEALSAQHDALVAANLSLTRRHDLLLSSAAELVKVLKGLRGEMGELADRISDDVARVQRDLE